MGVKKKVAIAIVCALVVGCSGCLSYSHYKYAKRAEVARKLPEGASAKPGRIYFELHGAIGRGQGPRVDGVAVLADRRVQVRQHHAAGV